LWDGESNQINRRSESINQPKCSNTSNLTAGLNTFKMLSYSALLETTWHNEQAAVDAIAKNT